MRLVKLCAQVAPTFALLVAASPEGRTQEAYLQRLQGAGWNDVHAVAVLQPQGAEEAFVAGTDAAHMELRVAALDVNGAPIAAAAVQPGLQQLSVAEAIRYEYGGIEMFAVLCNQAGAACSLFLFDSACNLLADWVYPIQHPGGVPSFSATGIAWEPAKQRLAICGNVDSFGLTYDVGVFTVNGAGLVVDEMRWFEFGLGGAFNSCQAIGIEADPWSGGFLLLVQGSAWLGGYGFMPMPLQFTGQPRRATQPWVTSSFVCHGFALDLLHSQVLVYGEVFAFGPGVSYSDVCVWLKDSASVGSGVIGAGTFSRFASTKGHLETARGGAFGAADPRIFAMLTRSDSVPGLTYFDVGVNTISQRSRVETWSFGGVMDLAVQQNYATSPAGYSLDQILTGWSVGMPTALVRRPSTGQRDTVCEAAPPDLARTPTPHGAQTVAIQLKYTYKKGAALHSPWQPLVVKRETACEYPEFADGGAH